MPAAPPTVFVPTPPGSPGTPPKQIYAPPPAGVETLSITGAVTAGVNGVLKYAGLNNEKPAWSSDGTIVAGASNTICEYTGTAWKISRSSVYTALKTSAAANPVGLTTWTVTPGSGSPVVAASAVAAPSAVFVPS